MVNVWLTNVWPTRPRHAPSSRSGLDDLIRLVHGVDPDADALHQLGVAVRISGRLGDLGDNLLGHFFDQARRAGASWRQIGSMGVTKQAAQQRSAYLSGAAAHEGSGGPAGVNGAPRMAPFPLKPGIQSCFTLQG